MKEGKVSKDLSAMLGPACLRHLLCAEWLILPNRLQNKGPKKVSAAGSCSSPSPETFTPERIFHQIPKEVLSCLLNIMGELMLLESSPPPHHNASSSDSNTGHMNVRGEVRAGD